MAVTHLRGHKLAPQSISRGGSIPDANVKVNISEWAEALEKRKTPIWSRIKQGASVDAIKNEWGQSYLTPIYGTINEALDTTETTIDVDTASGKAGDANALQKWMVVEIIDYVAGTDRLDYATREEVIVSLQPSAATAFEAVRGNGSGTGVAHADGAYWAVCGVAMPYNQDFEFSPVTRGDRLFNYPQRFYTMVGADVAARNTPDYEHEGDSLLDDLEKKTADLKYFAERTVVSGSRLEGDQSGGNNLPYKMGGIDYFVTNHSGRVTNMGGATLSAYDLEAVLRDAHKDLNDGGAKTLLMGIDTAAIFDSLLNPLRRADMSDTKLNLVTDSIRFRWGTIEITPTDHLPEGIILFVDFKDMSIRPYRGCSWTSKTIATKGPYDQMALWGDYTFQMTKIEKTAKIWNFNTDLDAYPRREYF